MRLLKCYGTCNNKYPKEELEEYNGKNYCKICLDKMLKERADRNELYSIIKSLYNVSYPTGLMLKQIKQYKDENNYTYRGMTLTLKYCQNLPGISFSPTMGIGIIPHQYERAKLDYIQKTKREENCSNNIIVKPVIIKIPRLNNENQLMKEKLINLEDLL